MVSKCHFFYKLNNKNKTKRQFLVNGIAFDFR